MVAVVSSACRRRRDTPAVEEEREGGEGRARFEGRPCSSSSSVDAIPRVPPALPRPLIADESTFPLPFCSVSGGGGGGGTYLLMDRRAFGEAVAAVAAGGTRTFFVTILVVVLVVVLMIGGLL